MHIDNITLVNELLVITQNATTEARRLKTLGIDVLNNKMSPESWSALECLEHLNLYGDFYLPAIENAIVMAGTTSGKLFFSPGLIGNYFAGLMKVKAGKMKKMSSPKDKNPAGSRLTMTNLDRFLKQCAQLESLLEQARTVNLTKTKTPISLTRFIRLRLGDTLRFFTYHIERHVLQATRAAGGLTVPGTQPAKANAQAI